MECEAWLLGPAAFLGPDATAKLEISAQLSKGQRSLLSFWVLYGHSRSGINEFYDLVPFLPNPETTWPALKTAMRHFQDDTMLCLLERMETLDCERKAETDPTRSNTLPDGIVANSELSSQLAQLDLLFQETVPATLARIGTYIRNHPAEFVTP